jgi:DNA-binding transcriptional MerR regulator
MDELRMRVGELAQRAGVTVRTLHHWDEIGLLAPSQRSAAGHRLYDENDLFRLQRILALRRVGLSLDQARAWIERPDRSLATDLELHIARLDSELARLESVRSRLESLARHLRATGKISVDDLLACLECMMNVEKHFTPEQLAQLEQRAKQLGPEAIADTERAWRDLIAEVKEAMARRTDPAGAEAQALAKRWMELVERFTGGDAAIAAGVGRVWRHEGPQLREQFGGPEPGMFEYIQKALAARP